MFIFDWLPTFVFQILLVIGIVLAIITTLFSRLIPAIYDLMVTIVMITCLSLGLISFGVQHEDAKYAKALADAKVAIANLQTQSAKITTQTVVQYVDRVKIVKEKGDVIEKKVPVYISSESDAKCVVDAGFVRGYNSSASRVSDTAAKPDAASSAAKSTP